MTDQPGLFEIMYSLRSMRRLKPDPVSDELIWKILEAATRAPVETVTFWDPWGTIRSR